MERVQRYDPNLLKGEGRDSKPRQRLNKSVKVKKGGRAIYSSYPDLAEWQKEMKGRELNPGDWRALFLSWISQGQIGCVFAVKLAREARLAGWSDYVVEDFSKLAEQLTRTIDAETDKQTEALHFFLPNITTADDVVRLLNELTLHERWSCHEITIELDKFDDKMSKCQVCRGDHMVHEREVPDLNVGLRFRLKNGQMAWVLGVAPYSEMAMTRRFEGAPFSVLFIRTGGSMDGIEEGRAVHLCDIRAQQIGISKEEFREDWDNDFASSKRLKANVIDEGAYCKARASVTFTIPQRLRAQIRLDWRETYGEAKKK